jgi:hypothetical protein
MRSGGLQLDYVLGSEIFAVAGAIDLEVAPTCLSMTSSRAAHNTFVSPYITCPTGVDATAGSANELVNPLFAGNV